jgi:hypothetical protein
MTLRRSAATLACLSAIAGSVLGGSAQADPSNSGTVTYDFTDCVASSGGTVSDFQAVKQFSEAAALHLLDGSGNFVAMKAVVLGPQTVDDVKYEDGQVLFATPWLLGHERAPDDHVHEHITGLGDHGTGHRIHRSELAPRRADEFHIKPC